MCEIADGKFCTANKPTKARRKHKQGMESHRFTKFIGAVEGIHKAVQKIKLSEAPKFGLKSVHLFWLCELLKKSEGMTACELAEKSNINRSLVSREIETLRCGGYVITGRSGKSGYNAKIVLSEKGRLAAKKIESIALDFQNRTSVDITNEELESFYATLNKIHLNLSSLATEDGGGRRATVARAENESAT